jgi:hypothetical protein
VVLPVAQLFPAPFVEVKTFSGLKRFLLLYF